MPACRELFLVPSNEDGVCKHKESPRKCPGNIPAVSLTHIQSDPKREFEKGTKVKHGPTVVDKILIKANVHENSSKKI